MPPLAGLQFVLPTGSVAALSAFSRVSTRPTVWPVAQQVQPFAEAVGQNVVTTASGDLDVGAWSFAP